MALFDNVLNVAIVPRTFRNISTFVNSVTFHAPDQHYIGPFLTEFSFTGPTTAFDPIVADVGERVEWSAM